ncbi:TPA: type VI secretion system-associated protein TagO [Pseudomonas aeruginosa]|nr:type VI secretion system-associated protein TagO [Pseudomonas aeruginosa]
MGLAIAGCDSGQPASAASPDCTTIVSALERLACFDRTAGTPPTPMLVRQAVSAAPTVSEPEIVVLLRENEGKRGPEGADVLMLRTADSVPGQQKVVISAPAAGGTATEPYLGISCLSNISRLQLIARAPIEVNRMNIRLLLDNRPLSATRPWQVLEDGRVVDAGRGLVAIEQLRLMTQPAERLWVESDYAPFDGVSFDVSSLHSLMASQREACHW